MPKEEVLFLLTCMGVLLLMSGLLLRKDLRGWEVLSAPGALILTALLAEFLTM